MSRKERIIMISINHYSRNAIALAALAVLAMPSCVTSSPDHESTALATLSNADSMTGAQATMNNGELPTPDGTTPPSIIGIWQFQNGDFLDDSSVGVPQYVNLDGLGNAEIYTSTATQGIKGDIHGIFAMLDPKVLSLELPDSEFGGDKKKFARGRHDRAIRDCFKLIRRLGESSSSSVHYYSVAFPDSTSLTLTDPSGGVSTFQRVTSIGTAAPMLASSAQLLDVVPATAWPQGAIAATPDIGLLYSFYDSTNTGPGAGASKVSPIAVLDPTDASEDEAPYVTIATTQFGVLQTTAEDDYWFSIGGGGCGFNDLQHWTPDSVQANDFDPDDVDDMFSAAWDGTHVWVAANVATNDGDGPDVGQLIAVDDSTSPASEAERLSLSSDYSLDAITFRGDELWALVSFTNTLLVQLDPTTGDAIETYALPATIDLTNSSLNGLVAFDGDFYSWYETTDPNTGDTTATELLQISGL